MADNPMRRRRPVRPKKSNGRSRIGERYDVTVGPVAHGGHCVARVPDGDALRVVFVRHALPGELVTLVITEGSDGDRFWRGDAVAILEASADRVEAPCAVAGPGGCGGCDFQHASLAAQRDLKTAVLREQLARLGRLDTDLARNVVVKAVPGDVDGVRWRTRQQFVLDPTTGARSMRRHRSHDLVTVDDCLIAREDARVPGESATETVTEVVTVGDVTRAFEVAADGFWQVHPAAPALLVSEVLHMLDPKQGERALDLYSGVGLFSAFLAERVGPSGSVVAVEGDRRAAELSQNNVSGLEATAGDVSHVLATSYPDPFDIVVLDPPREGAKRTVVEAIAARSPRAVVYVACDPAALARDVAFFAEFGYELSDLKAYDLFPMTHHFETLALLRPSS